MRASQPSGSFLQNSEGKGDANFDAVLKENDHNLAIFHQQFGSDLVNQVRDSIAFQVEESGLECPDLEENQIFKNLRNRLRLFFFTHEEYRRRKGPSRQQ